MAMCLSSLSLEVTSFASSIENVWEIFFFSPLGGKKSSPPPQLLETLSCVQKTFENRQFTQKRLSAPQKDGINICQSFFETKQIRNSVSKFLAKWTPAGLENRSEKKKKKMFVNLLFLKLPTPSIVCKTGDKSMFQILFPTLLLLSLAFSSI